jgi:hypothetical protein
MNALKFKGVVMSIAIVVRLRQWSLLSIVIVPLFAMFVTGHALASTKTDSEENPYVWKPKTTSVSVFKNGYGFFTREGEVELKGGWGHANEVPPAAFGTLAIYAANPQQLVDVVGVGAGEMISFEEMAESIRDTSRKATLEASLSMKVKLVSRTGSQSQEVTGSLKAISGGYAVVEQTNGAAAIPLEAIVSMQRVDLPLRFHVVEETGTVSERVDLHMAYLRSGIVWIPEYTLKIIDESTAELTLRGTLVNEAEDLHDCDVHFVVGVPHFVHSEMLSPVAIGQILRSIGSAIPTAGIPLQNMSQVMNRAVIANDFDNGRLDASVATSGAGTETFKELLGTLPPSDAAGAGDYSVYSKKGVTVRKGERAVITLMSKRISYGHQYAWTPGSVGRGDGASEDLVHRLVLENSTETPWTTGPCLALSGNQPLSEDILRYTPVRAKGELTVTTAINIAKSITESEVDRKLKAHEPQPNSFLDLVTLRGTVQLKSFESKPVSIRVTRSVQGRPLDATSNGSIRMDSEKLRLVERAGQIEWSVELQPGKTTELSYTYERFVPSH